jgi:hypothetical protein
MADQKTVNTQFALTVNLSEVAARTGIPGQGGIDLPTGGYKVKVTEAGVYEKEPGRQSLRFLTVVTEGEFAGTEVKPGIYIGLDLSKPGNLRSLKTALMSCGYTAAQLEVGNINIDASTFMDREAFVYIKAKDANDPSSQGDKQFITPQAFAQLSGSAAGSIAATTTVAAPKASLGTPVAAPSLGGSPAMSVTAPKPSGGGLRAMLGKA